MVIYERSPLKDLHGAARKAKKRKLERELHGGDFAPAKGERRDAILQELHDAGELPLCNRCGREIGWNGLSNGRYENSGGQTCNDCVSDERERQLKGD